MQTFNIKIFTLILTYIISLGALKVSAQGKDTVFVSNKFTTHMVFPSEIRYIDVSNQGGLFAEAVQGYSNVLALKCPNTEMFKGNLTVMLSTGTIQSFVVISVEESPDMIVDLRRQNNPTEMIREPTMSEMLEMDKKLYHIGQRKGKVTVLCDLIIRQNSQVFLRLEIINSSARDLVFEEMTLVVGPRGAVRKRQVRDNSYPQRINSLGTLSTPSGGTSHQVFCYEDFEVNTDEVLKLFVHFKDMEDFEITLSGKDLN